MSDDFTVLNPGVDGDVMDETAVIYATPPTTRKRPRVVLTGEGNGEIVGVTQNHPAGSEYGLITRPILNYPGTSAVTPGSVTLVPSGAETTVVSYTVPASTVFYFIGVVGSGDINARYRVFIDANLQLTGVTSVANPTLNLSFPIPPFTATAGQTIFFKVTHYAAGLQGNFDGTILGYIQ
jgi:hypothetical protein